jgi:hypothetical protein
MSQELMSEELMYEELMREQRMRAGKSHACHDRCRHRGQAKRKDKTLGCNSHISLSASRPTFSLKFVAPKCSIC